MKKRFSGLWAAVAVAAVLVGVLSVGRQAEAYTNKYPFSFLEGYWRMSNGSGTAVADGTSGTLKLDSGTARVSSLSANADDTGGTAAIRVKSAWILRVGGNSIDYPLNFQEVESFTNTGADEYTATYGGGTVSGKVVVTLTSSTTATVTQTETETSSSDPYAVAISYNLTLTDDDDDDSDDDSSSGCSAGWSAMALLAVVPLLGKRGSRR